MAVYIANQMPDSQGAVLSLLVNMLVSAGWTYRSSGDGLAAYNSSGNVFTTTGSGATGWDNTGAWACLRDPALTREYCFYRASSTAVRFKYSRGAGFTSGGSATTMPTATDEKYIAGTAAADSAQWTTSGVYNKACVFYGRADTQAPYGFWFAGGDAYRGLIRTMFAVDPVKSVSADPDPYVYLWSGVSSSVNATGPAFWFPNLTFASTSALSGGITSASYPYAVMDAAASTYIPVGAAAYYTASVNVSSNASLAFGSITHGVGGTANPFDTASFDSYPILYQRPNNTTYVGTGNLQSATGYTGVKGWSTLCRWTNVPMLNWSLANSKTLISCGSVWLPWDGTTIPTGLV